MRFHHFSGTAVLVSVCLLSGSSYAGVIYDESVSGDLSNSGLSPTVLTVSLGSNEVFGTTGRTTAPDRDYFSFTVPSGLVLSAITVLPGTQTVGADSFIGLQAGPQVTVSTSATTADGLLGWFHYDAGDIGNNILPEMGSSGLGATGFTPPLGSGTYSFWVQETGSGTVPYGFDFTVSTPEPATYAMTLGGLALVGLMRRRRSH